MEDINKGFLKLLLLELFESTFIRRLFEGEIWGNCECLMA